MIDGSSDNFWMVTVTGRQIWPLKITSSDIDPVDIAHGLANICRFGGQCKKFYSVAQHSVHVSDCLPKKLRLRGLLHDAAEAYVGDVIRPIKRFLGSSFERIEDSVWTAIAGRFSIDPSKDQKIKCADNRVMFTEKQYLVTPHEGKWSEEQTSDPSAEPYDDLIIIPWAPEKAKDVFLSRLYNLGAS